MLTFAKLWVLLSKKGLKKTDLLEVISAPTLAKLSKNENVNSSMIEKLCEFLQCQPGDIMEYVNEDKLIADAKNMDDMQKYAIDQLKEQGYTEDDLKTMLRSAMEDYMNSMFNGDRPISSILSNELKDMEGGT